MDINFFDTISFCVPAIRLGYHRKPVGAQEVAQTVRNKDQTCKQEINNQLKCTSDMLYVDGLKYVVSFTCVWACVFSLCACVGA